MSHGALLSVDSTPQHLSTHFIGNLIGQANCGVASQRKVWHGSYVLGNGRVRPAAPVAARQASFQYTVHAAPRACVIVGT